MKKIKGFTLLEVLVALLITTVGLTALAHQTMQNIDVQHHLNNKAIAQWVAQNKTEEALFNWNTLKKTPAARDQGTDKLANREWFWTGDLEKLRDSAIMAYTVNVFADSDKSNALASLTVYIPVNEK